MLSTGPMRVLADDDGDDLRVAVLSTPRSGNTWLRGLLDDVAQAEELAVHTPEDLPWNNFPRRCWCSCIGCRRPNSDPPLLARGSES